MDMQFSCWVWVIYYFFLFFILECEAKIILFFFFPKVLIELYFRSVSYMDLVYLQ